MSIGFHSFKIKDHHLALMKVFKRRKTFHSIFVNKNQSEVDHLQSLVHVRNVIEKASIYNRIGISIIKINKLFNLKIVR